MQKIELLAPAGNAASALAAFDAGADAIYAGLARFNARERGENFTHDSMARIVDYAHSLGRKVYITFNTLVHENELADVAEELASIEEIAPDALIVQDLGVAKMIRDFFPSLAIHASTQMALHNSAGLEFARRIGAKRVILERQVTGSELAVMRKAAPEIEIEIFAHGSLCCSLSGVCFFSSWLGGASGNRGRCKQPCRRRYFSNRGNGFFFSPMDLCLLERLDEFREMGIASLKIEGRLRQPDYVAAAVEAYRKVLDASGTDAKILGEARNILSRGCGRKWSDGFYSPESMKQLIQYDAPGTAGALCGRIHELRDNGFAFETHRRLHVGDRLRMQPASGEEGPAVTVTRMFVDNRSAVKAAPGDSVFVCCDKPVAHDALVFKIGGSFADYSGRIDALPPRKTALDLAVTVRRDRVDVVLRNGALDPWSMPVELADAQNHALDEDALRKEFAAADSPVFRLGKCSVDIDGRYFFPQSELKKVRRAFWDFCKSRLRPEAVFHSGGDGMEKFRRYYVAMHPEYSLPERAESVVMMRPNGEQPARRDAVRCASVLLYSKRESEVALPEFCPEERLDSLRRAIQRAYDDGIRRFRVTSLYGIELMKKYPDARIAASFPLPVANSLAAALLAENGVHMVQAQIELECAEIAALVARSVLPVEVYRFGRPALLTTRAKLPVEGDIRDNRGNEFRVTQDKTGGFSRLYARKVFSIPRVPNTSDFYDLTQANWNDPVVSDFPFAMHGEL